MDQNTHDSLLDVLAYAQKRLGQLTVADVGDEPTKVEEKEPAMSADMSRMKEKAGEVMKICGTPVLMELLGTFETNKVSGVNPAHGNHFVRLCNEALEKHAQGKGNGGASAPLDPLA